MALQPCEWEGCSRKTKSMKNDKYFCHRHYDTTPKRKLKDVDRYTNNQGYVMIRIGTRFVPEHRAVMERVLERPLRKRESVHHKNGIRHDNRERNLELWVGPIKNGVRGYDLECPHCGERYYDETKVSS